MFSLRGFGVLVALGCAVLVAGLGCSSSKVVDVMEDDGQGVDVSTLPPEELIFRYCGTGELDAMETLLESDPNLVNIIEDADSRTPLHVAARNGNEKMVQLLLDKGADPRKEDINGEIPADCARQAGHLGLDKLLMDAAKNAG